MTIEDAIRAIAEDYDLDVSDLKIVLRAVTRGKKASQARWIDLCFAANCGHSAPVTLNFHQGCITSDGTVTSLRALRQTVSDGRGR